MVSLGKRAGSEITSLPLDFPLFYFISLGNFAPPQKSLTVPEVCCVITILYEVTKNVEFSHFT